jgi:transposase
METFTMSRKELPRPGLVAAALAGRITNREGARALGLSPRQFQRLKQRVRQDGPGGLRHRSRGRPSSRRMAATIAVQVQALMQDRYAGFNDTHLTEQLREQHGLTLSRESVRRLRVQLGQRAVHPRRPPQHRRRRPRAPAPGQLVQLDGSPFDWLQGRGPAMTLLGAIDDATSQVVALHFRPTEDLHGYAVVLQQMFRSQGVPLTLYGDGVNIFVRTDAHWTVEEQLAGEQAPTHLGRVLRRLGIGYIRARSPQGKGRIERLWGTLQDRLVSELRLHGIRTGTAANAFLPGFIADFNRRFAQPAAAPPVWRRPPRDLDRLLGCHYARVVARDNTVRLGPRLIQIPPGPGRRSYAGRRVEVRELLDGRVVVFAGPHCLAQQPAPPGEFRLAPRAAPTAPAPAPARRSGRPPPSRRRSPPRSAISARPSRHHPHGAHAPPPVIRGASRSAPPPAAPTPSGDDIFT